MDTDADDLVQQDAEKAKNAIQSYRNGGFSPDPGKLLEQAMFALAILCIVFMIVALPWVGDDSLIPGHIWIGSSVGGILLFGFLGWLVRIINQSFSEVDKRATEKFSRR